MAEPVSRNSRPVDPDHHGLENLREHLLRTEADLRARGYHTERSTAHPGYQASNQLFGEETQLLILFGQLVVECGGQLRRLGPGDLLHVPAGVPYQLTVVGETTVYWIQAHRPERIGESATRSEPA